MVTRKVYIPKRADILWVNLDLTRGHEQRGRRPAVVLSPWTYNATAGLVVVCPITSQVKKYPFEVAIMEGNVQGVVLVDQIRAFDWKARKFKKAGTISENTLLEIQRKLKTLLF